MKDNLYWAVYKNLEKELLELSYQIHIDDNQLEVYSVKIAELLLRCSVEIESIAKDLYEHEDGNMNPTKKDGKPRDLYFDTDCLNLLEYKWTLSKKKVFVAGASFYLKEESNIILTPLKNANKKGKDGSKWKQAYMEVKHNRANSLKRDWRLLGSLIDAMAALFLLNVYYRNEKIQIPQDPDITIIHDEYDISNGSEIFSVKCAFVNFPESPIQGIGISGDEQDGFVYLRFINDNSYKTIVESMKIHTQKFISAIQEKMCQDMSYDDRKKITEEVKSSSVIRDNMMSIARQLVHAKQEVILNKGQKIYEI